MMSYTVGVAVGLTIGLSICPKACASDIWATATCCSWHAEKGHNGRNPGVGVEWQTENPTVRVIAGAYLNSMERTSVYAGVSWMPLSWGDWRLGVAPVAVTGYLDGDAPAFAPIPLVSFERGDYGLNIGFIPSATKGVVGLQLKARLLP